MQSQGSFDPDITAAIQASLKSEPLQLDRRQRKQDLPVGLKNVGNTCYFNSFIQAFFFLPNMSSKLLQSAIAKPARGAASQDDVKQQRIATSL